MQASIPIETHTVIIDTTLSLFVAQRRFNIDGTLSVAALKEDEVVSPVRLNFNDYVIYNNHHYILHPDDVGVIENALHNKSDASAPVTLRFRVLATINSGFEITTTNGVFISESHVAKEYLEVKSKALAFHDQSTKSGIWIWDIYNNSVSVSENIYTLLGLPTEGKSLCWSVIQRFIDQQHYPIAYDAYAQLIEHHEPISLSLHLNLPDKGKRQVAIRSEKIISAEGTPFIVGSLQEVGESAYNTSVLEKVMSASAAAMLVYSVIKNSAGSAFKLLFRNKQCTSIKLKHLVESPDSDSSLDWIKSLYHEALLHTVAREEQHKSSNDTHWYHVNAAINEDLFIVSISDITEKKTAEIELKRQKEILQNCLDAIPHMVWMYEVKTDTYFFNERWYNYTGLTPEYCQHFNHQNTDVFHLSQRGELKHKLNEYIEKGIPYAGELFIKSQEGFYRWHLDLAFPIKDENGNVEMWMGTFTDVHDQFTGEKQLNENKELLEAVFNTSINGIEILESIYDESGTLIDFRWKYLNEKAIRFYGKEHLIDREVSEEVPEVLSNGLFENYREVLQTGQAIQFEKHYRYHQLDYWFHFHIAKLEELVIITFQDITQRKYTEFALQESKFFIQQVANSTPDFIYVLDVCEPKIVYINKRTNEVLGVPVEKVYAQGKLVFRKIMHPDDYARCMTHIADLLTLKEEETREIEVRFRTSESEWRWFKIRDTLFKRNEKGLVWQTVGIAQDIHDKKEAEEKIKLQYQIDRQAEKIANIGNWQWNITTGKLIWGDNLYHLLGREQGSIEPTIDAFIESLHPEDRYRLLEESVNIVEGVQEPRPIYDFRVINKDNSIRYLRAASKHLVHNGEQIAIGSVRDITADVFFEQALKDRLTFIETLIDSSIDRVFAYDQSLRCLAWNKKCEQGYGKTKDDVIGCIITEVFDTLKTYPLSSELVEKALQGNTIHLPVQYLVNDDAYLEIYYIPICNEKNEILGVLNILHDITDALKTQQELKLINASLEQKNKALEGMNEQLSTFAFVASHDLREPLRKIQVFSHRLLERESETLSVKGKEYLDRIVASIGRMNSLIDDILTFSKASIMEEVFQDVDLNQIIETVANDLSEELCAKGAILHYEKLPMIKGIASQLHQLLQNLISNAIKFTSSERTPIIRINTYYEDGTELDHPSVVKDKQYLALEVCDNGIGFEEQYTHKIFQMFQRLHGLKEYPGTGMGLAICKKVMENHEGFLIARSIVNEGSTFTCYLPVH